MTPLVSLLACGWGHLPHQDDIYLDLALWDPRGAVPTLDGLYVPLPSAGALVLIDRDGKTSLVDVDEGRVTRIDAAPDGQTILAFVERYVCTDEDAKRDVDTIEECEGDIEVTTELTLVRGGEVSTSQPVSGAYNAVAFSEDGRHAVAYLDFSQGVDVDSVLNLTGVVVVDLAAQQNQLVAVGFAADRVLFVENDLGEAERAVVVSRNAVAVIDLLADPPEVTVTFPLTLDPDTVVDPVGIDLTPDGRYALLSARGSSDLYALDLEVNAINIVELAGAPGAMAVSGPADRTVLVYPGQPVVELLDHAFFDVQSIPLDESMDRITLAGEQAVLWDSTGGHDLYRLDLETDDLVEYVLQNPAVSVTLAPTNEFAVVLTRAEGSFGGDGVDAIYDQHPGMEIVDLRTDDTEPFLLEGQGLGVAFATDGTYLQALVLQQDVDYLYRLDLYTRESAEIELSAPPVAIGAMPDGRFYITHDRALGLVSFLDPANGRITEVAGFASLGIIDPIELVEEVKP